MRAYLLIVVLLVGLLVGCSTEVQSDVIKSDVTASAILEEDYVKIPRSEVSSELKKYTYEVNGVSVRYFVVKDESGAVRTALDACDVCGAKGYTQDGTDVVCNNCGLRFSIADIGISNSRGGCWPSRLENIEQDNYVYISKSELAGNAFRYV